MIATINANLFDFNGSRANHCRGFYYGIESHHPYILSSKSTFLLTKKCDFDKCDKFALKSQMRSK